MDLPTAWSWETSPAITFIKNMLNIKGGPYFPTLWFIFQKHEVFLKYLSFRSHMIFVKHCEMEFPAIIYLQNNSKGYMCMKLINSGVPHENASLTCTSILFSSSLYIRTYMAKLKPTCLHLMRWWNFAIVQKKKTTRKQTLPKSSFIQSQMFGAKFWNSCLGHCCN